ncbi:bile acid:sodium symporter family protein [Umezakia ovalisporum]|uniref:Bile acid:sodium symporter family protein n=2 Tax=Umezakia ovalisporum TaxID=75695 RepID=A0AA43GWN4_9CYAN|nr:bile acid:sodium symporter family protein [Umezakia ovalisporum]MDH6055325.1 bile acid:sodium symporter family protein [Umezakia ovalisporum FSS-43]MDH6062630.1 bile acid:sodium symporter family protein [Umezakia ovalisporum FSS-62]MDH6066418.1 bile acid:sodium symporter family protein [Umezakia ovalisporum APH033B]MDH6071260.1 bile acid:sodium symporter family protein [Umezakia ovalisporum CobakiLakeA]MDH6073736.1 bile acid:sodium symporter family protein [Umezakia ovalisporum CS-1034]
MEANFLTAIFLPMALFIIMLGMGLSLTLEDFQLIVIYPKAVVIGLVAQLIMLPIVGFGIASLFPLDPQLAVGVMILAACPGGATSNMITFLAGGDVALSVTLTAISSLITVFTIPLVVNFSMQTFLGAGTTIELPLLNSILQIVVMTLVPVSIGMVTRGYAAGIAEKVDKPVKWLSLFFLAVVIAGVLLRERNNVISYVIDVGLVTLILNLLTMALGFGIATLTRLGEKAARAITVEVGIQNGTLAIAIASSPTLLNTPTMAIPGAIYSLVMFGTSAGFAWWASHRQSLSKASTLGK